MNFHAMGHQVSDPLNMDARWSTLLLNAERSNLMLYALLIGLRHAGAELREHPTFRWRIVPPGKIAPKVRMVLMPFKDEIQELLQNLGG